MKQYHMVTAERISKALEDGIYSLMDKLCEDEAPEVKDMAWSMLVTRLGFLSGQGDCFVLPPLDEC